MHEPLNPAGTATEYSTGAPASAIRSNRNALETAEHYAAQAALLNRPVLIELLRQARAALGPEWYDLAGRIDDVLPSTLGGEPILGSLRDVERGLVWERLPSGEFGWLRP